MIREFLGITTDSNIENNELHGENAEDQRETISKVLCVFFAVSSVH